MTEQTIDAQFVLVEMIKSNPRQPRTKFGPEGLAELAMSIKEHGVIQPLIVSKDGQNGDYELTEYTLIAGERRLLAAIEAGLEEVPVIIRSADDQARLELALIENVQRENLSPMEMADAYSQLHEEFGLSLEEIAERVAKSRPHVSNTMRLLGLSEGLREKTHGGEISQRVAEAALTVEQLPPKVREAAEGYGDPRYIPSKIIEAVELGQLSSDEVRQRVQHIKEMHTKNLNEAIFPPEHDFEKVQGIVSAQCESCPARELVGNTYRCADPDCWNMKSGLWQLAALEKASWESGIPMLDLGEDENEHYSISKFYEDAYTLGPEGIFAQGCPHDHLRLMYDKSPTVSEALSLTEHPHVAIVCHHGNGKDCTCEKARERAQRQAAKAEQGEDIEAQPRKEKREKLHNEIVAPAEMALAEAFAAEHDFAWLLIYRKLVKTGGSENWDVEKIQRKIARYIVEKTLPYLEPEERFEHSRAKVLDEILRPIGREDVFEGGDDPIEELQRSFDRVQGWVESLALEYPLVDALEGNIANLDGIVFKLEPLSPLYPDDKRIEALFLDIDYESKRLRALLPIIETELAEPLDMDRVCGLVNLELFDDGLAEQIEAAGYEEIQYALALVTGDEERTEVLQKALER